MKDFIFNNGLKLIYKKSNSELTSIAISLNAGAGRDEDILGVAHATEHMVYKGTKSRNEKQINEELSNIFGFQNAMTNYPYVVYYGTLLSEDLEAGIELFSDILINPSFSEDGFKEEIDVIIEELKEWDEELEQYCEDKLFLNSMENRRIKYPIIGTEESLSLIKLNDIKVFYSKHYCANNAAITIISSLEFEEVKKIVEKHFSLWKSQENMENKEKCVDYKKDIFIDKKQDINSAKVQLVFPIHELSHLEIKALRIFNQYFGEGVNSVLFDNLRTKQGLVYDVLTRVANEEYIKIYKITYSTCHENVDKSINIIKELINDVDNLRNKLSKEDIKRLSKSFKLKRLFGEEQSVRLAMQLATYETMFGEYSLYLDESSDLDKLSIDFIIDTAIKVLRNMIVEVITK
ncbi:pitrilysin family protein [uncultured Clostridium sp.]|uniref:M16 family metallopeptidase n=1 Tax=uncultured Clostridium sp. TaxID=59620 RepID=UPI0025E7ED69|nr:pitrilysin family protein [uncultured Clostridium sp.]MDU4883412.1 pitrilysin family protein [Clostridium celatum]MDU7076475.1 pitrilysin family protein [Clostridium celatum]